MSLKNDILEALKATEPQRYPDIVYALQEMSKDDREAVLAALENLTISASRLAEIITKNGWSIRADSIRALRRGDMKSVSIEDLKGMFK